VGTAFTFFGDLDHLQTQHAKDIESSGTAIRTSLLVLLLIPDIAMHNESVKLMNKYASMFYA